MVCPFASTQSEGAAWVKGATQLTPMASASPVVHSDFFPFGMVRTGCSSECFLIPSYAEFLHAKYSICNAPIIGPSNWLLTRFSESAALLDSDRRVAGTDFSAGVEINLSLAPLVL
jgi:hypothetical protein